MKEKLKTAVGALLFACIFGAVGVFASWVIVTSVYDGYRAREWVLVSATVDHYNDNSVSYRYKVGGREFVGNRIGSMAISGRDSMDGWQEEMDTLLTTAKNDKKPIMVRVNPDDPAESVINPDIRWAPLVFFVPFALGFGGVGLGALWMMFRTFVPAPPKSGTGNGLGAAWFFTIMWNSIAMPIAFLFVPRMIDDGEWLGLFVLIFPLIGLLLLWGAIYATWKAFFGLFKGSKMPPYKGRPHVDGNKKATDLTPEEIEQIREMVDKKPRMVESMPEVLQEMEQDNGARPAMVGMVSAALPDGASRRLAQADAEEERSARLHAAIGKLNPDKPVMAEMSPEKQVAIVKKATWIFWIVVIVLVANSGLLGFLYQFVKGLAQGDATP